MSRFSKLEFGSQPASESRSEVATLAKDEPFYLHDAQAAFEEGDFERALRSYARVLEHNPKNPVPWTGQVRMLIELGENREAKLWADKALERFPREPELLAAKAAALARLGDVKAALAFSDASFEERGDTFYVWVARGDVLLARNEARAGYCFDKAISLSPGNWLVRWIISRVYFHYRRIVLALKTVQEALELDASRAVLWLDLGVCQRELGLVGAAAESMGRALQLNPRNAAAREAMRTLPEKDILQRLWGRLRLLFSG
jgi:tetratricopeptide (TPR) repeat protein